MRVQCNLAKIMGPCRIVKPRGSRAAIRPTFGPISRIVARLQTHKHPFGCYLMTIGPIYDAVKAK